MRRGKAWPVAWVGVRRATPLFWQIFATNALLLAVATAVLAFTPLTISFPVALTEVVVLVCGLGAMLLVNAALLRRAMRPLRQLGTTMRRIDPLHPGHRVAIDRADPEVEALSDTFNAMLDRLEDERRESARRALAAQEQERRRIARELHDEVGQSLTARAAQPRDGVAGARAVRPAEARAHPHGLSGTRSRPPAPSPRACARRCSTTSGSATPCARSADQFNEQAEMRIDAHIDAGVEVASPEAELVVYRVAQEALTNVARHAGVDARRARACPARRDGRAGRDATRAAGSACDASTPTVGIRGMRERAVLVGAELDAVVARGGTACGCRPAGDRHERAARRPGPARRRPRRRAPRPAARARRRAGPRGGRGGRRRRRGGGRGGGARHRPRRARRRHAADDRPAGREPDHPRSAPESAC